MFFFSKKRPEAHKNKKKMKLNVYKKLPHAGPGFSELHSCPQVRARMSSTKFQLRNSFPPPPPRERARARARG
ncbi:hypothetical protein HanPI659440_Chr09g0342071 [Helianthus annuus]|nr:hypothetical protein HanPI659440_Chr09g0342071 [Helianthus annuus]